MVNYFKVVISITFSFLLFGVLNLRIGNIPPLAGFLNPISGFWQNAESRTELYNKVIKIKGLQSTVSIKFDEHHVPHIFAENDYDLYFAQGYITAKDRLWQLDIQTRSASGRLAEILGSKAIETDRYHRRMGMVYGAEKTIRQMLVDPVMNSAITAYTAGVNSYIDQLAPKNYPIEFKLLDYSPEHWKPINCAFLFKLMSETLAGNSNQYEMSKALEYLGPEITNDLYPNQEDHQDPIIPIGTAWRFKKLKVPAVSKTFIASSNDSAKATPLIDGLGSNSWAISGSRSKNGYPILANDPHLKLTFPSIWYEIQLSSPTVNVNGVSLPGVPCVVIGYNQKISWGLTNVNANVLDWYQIRFKDAQKTAYWYNSKWNKVTKRIEIIKVHGQNTIYDTVFYTHHGPIVYEDVKKKPKGLYGNIPVGNALRWIAHDGSNDLKTFYLLNRGKSHADYREALTYFTAPAQSFIFASADNDIAITSNGKFPLKYKNQGKFIMDGSDPGNDWHGWIPYNQNPTIKNPERGFVSSANQVPTDDTYPYYLNWRFGQYYRGRRINEILTHMGKATVDSMRSMQLDNFSVCAGNVLPTLFAFLDSKKMNSEQQQAFQLLKRWDMKYDEYSIGATLFDTWWTHLRTEIWTHKLDKVPVSLEMPTYDRTEQLILKEPGSHWFDDPQTTEKENCKDIVSRSFRLAVKDLNSQFGRMGQSWQWGKVKATYVDHLGSIAGFGSGNFISGGNSGVINALRGNVGPSFRMVVQLGPTVKGYGIFPGGESGNPGSFYYDDMLPIWKSGKLKELLFLTSKEQRSKHIKATFTLINEQ